MSYANILYNIKRGFMIIGFTGYTASGCSTAKKFIVNNKKPEIPELSSVLQHIDESSYKILRRKWEELDWEGFEDIEVSHIIMMFAIHQSFKHNYKDSILKKIKGICEDRRKDLRGTKYLFYVSPRRLGHGVHDLIKAYEVTRSLMDKIRSTIFGENLYDYIETMQNYGDDIRKYGHVKQGNKEKSNSKNILVLPEAIRRIIKAYRVVNKKQFFAIDAFRNPFEVEYFKRRYSEFYLVNINRSEDKRREILIKKDIKSSQYDVLSNRERGKKVIERRIENIDEWITSQNINECAQKANFHISNNEATKENLRFQLIKLITLARFPGCIPPSRDEVCMELAMASRQKSGCLSRKVGAVIADEENVFGIGWNDPPQNQTPCILRSTHDLISRSRDVSFSEYELSDEFIAHINTRYSGKSLPFCFKDELYELEKNKDSKAGKRAEFTRSLHAEERAFLSIKEHSPHLKGSTLYSTDIPCTLCAKKAYHLGVKRIVYVDDFPGISISQTLRSGTRKDDIKIEPFEGATGEAYHQLYSNLMPEKDLLKILQSQKG